MQSSAYISQMSSGLRPVRPDVAVLIERATDRQVMRWDLRPTDWHRIWPELIGAEGAPAVPSQQEAQRAA
jgi:DNA-binding transcriptional regulator YdaS (Cro superfamily)